MNNGRLTTRQLKYARLVADGMNENDAVLEAGYSPISKYNTLLKLRENNRVCAQIKYYQKSDKDEEIASKQEREKFWTSIMNDPSYSAGVRLKASEYLGKAQGDFINNTKVEHSSGGKPVVLIPKSSPSEWEKFWEKENE